MRPAGCDDLPFLAWLCGIFLGKAADELPGGAEKSSEGRVEKTGGEKPTSPPGSHSCMSLTPACHCSPVSVSESRALEEATRRTVVSGVFVASAIFVSLYPCRFNF